MEQSLSNLWHTARQCKIKASKGGDIKTLIREKSNYESKTSKPTYKGYGYNFINKEAMKTALFVAGCVKDKEQRPAGTVGGGQLMNLLLWLI